MSIWRVQWVWAKEAGCPSMHRTEEPAKGEVAYLVGDWIMKNMGSNIRRMERADEEREFTAAARAVLQEVPALVSQGMVWEAYDRWQEFYEKYERHFGYPLFVMTGTVLVDARDAKMPLRTKKLMPGGPIPEAEFAGVGRPVVVRVGREAGEIENIVRTILRQLQAAGRTLSEEEYERLYFESAEEATRVAKEEAARAGRRATLDDANLAFERAFRRRVGLAGARLAGPLLGARVWTIQYADFGGAWHPSMHRNEGMAKAEVSEILLRLLDNLRRHASSFAMVRREDEYVSAARAADDKIMSLLSSEKDDVWGALEAWYAFMDEWEGHWQPIPLSMSIGTIRVEVRGS